MKKFLFFAVAALFVANSAYAKNDIMRFPIAAALAEPDAKAKLDPNIKFYFGNKSAGRKITQQLSSNKKANGVGKSDQAACNRAFLSALLSFQDRAKKEGGNKVVNITSYYYKNVFVSDKEFECGVGSIMSGVTLRGYIAK